MNRLLEGATLYPRGSRILELDDVLAAKEEGAAKVVLEKGNEAIAIDEAIRLLREEAREIIGD